MIREISEQPKSESLDSSDKNSNLLNMQLKDNILISGNVHKREKITPGFKETVANFIHENYDRVVGADPKKIKFIANIGFGAILGVGVIAIAGGGGILPVAGFAATVMGGIGALVGAIKGLSLTEGWGGPHGLYFNHGLEDFLKVTIINCTPLALQDGFIGAVKGAIIGGGAGLLGGTLGAGAVVGGLVGLTSYIVENRQEY